MPLIQQPGQYEATVKSASLGQSEKGTPFVSLLCATEKGEELTAFLYLSDAAFERTTKTLREVFGFDNNFEAVVEQVTGKPCSIVVECEEHNGKTRMKVKWVNRVGGGAIGAPLAGGQSLLAQLSARAKRIPTSAPAAAPRAPKAPANPTTTLQAAAEDIPF